METICGIYQPLFSAVGLGFPMTRFIFFTAVSLMGEVYIRPGYAFAEDGIRKWAVFSSEPGATYVPLGMIPVVLGLAAALFI